MAEVTLGSKGLVNADLILVQSASFSATFTHVDGDGDAIDHTGWSAWSRLRGGSTDLDLSSCVSFGEGGAIDMLVTDELTATIPVGTYEWDLIVEDDLGYATRVAYGKCKVYDSLARD